MPQFSKTTIRKLNLHLSNLKVATNAYKQNYQKSKEKNLQHSKIFTRNKNLVKALLIELLFFNVEIKNLNQGNKSVLNKILLKNKKIFVDRRFYNESYLLDENRNEINLKLQKLKNILDNEIKDLNSASKHFLKTSKLKLTESIRNSKKLYFLKKTILSLNDKIENYFILIKEEGIGKWYVYFARFLVISLLHFIPFIQLCTTLFYNQPNKQITHPITCYLFNVLPFLVPTINFTMPILNQDTISFLLLVPYLYFFIYSFKRYKISRKIAYQGSFALALMLFRYSLILSQEAITVIYKFAKRFFFLRKFHNIDLIRDDLGFYVDDLEELRNYREEFLQLGESIFSLDDVTKITKLWESTTIFSLLAVIALLYNYMYFIFRGQKPIIPVVTRTVQRMMIDRNGKES